MAFQNTYQPSYMGYNPPIPSGQAVGYQMPSYQSPTYEPPKYMQAAPTGSNSIIWVQGEAGAKSYLVAPNTTLMLMDSESQTFYLKSSDASGVPLPLRKFTYVEETDQQHSTAPVVSIDSGISPDSFNNMAKQLEQLKSEYDRMSRQYDSLSERIEKLTAAEPKRKPTKAVENDA